MRVYEEARVTATAKDEERRKRNESEVEGMTRQSDEGFVW